MQYTYALFINLEPALEAQVSVIKQQFANTHNWESSKTRPHITVANKELDEVAEFDLIQKLEEIVRVIHPFKIELRNYDNFRRPNSNTIYIALTDNKLNGFNLAANKAFGHKSQPMHVTIGRGLNDALFNKAWLKYSKAEFTGSCYINEAVLTRIENHRYKTVQVFKFNFKAPDKIQQTELF